MPCALQKAGDDSEEEDDEAANLQHLEQRLLAHDPSFTESDTWAAQEARKNKLTSTFLRGYWPPWDAEDVAQAHQLHLNVERARVPEVLWQPSMAGVDQAGLDELCAHLLRNYEHDTRVKLANVSLASPPSPPTPSQLTRTPRRTSSSRAGTRRTRTSTRACTTPCAPRSPPTCACASCAPPTCASTRGAAWPSGA